MNGYLATLFAFLLLAPAVAGGKTEQNNNGKAATKLVFGVIAPRGADTAVANWRPFTEAMSARLQVPVEIVAAADYKEIVGAFKEGRIDLAWLSNATALEVVEAGKGAVFAQMITKSGSTGYKSVLIVHQESKLNSLADVLKPGRGLVFGDGDSKSTSGHLVPLYYAFVKNRVNDPVSLFKEIRTGNHKTNALRTATREVDVATNNNEELQFFAAEQPDMAAKLRVIWTSPEIPQSPLVWSNTLPLPVKRQVRRFVTGYGKSSEAERKVLLQVNELSGFRKSSNRQLITISDLEMFNERLKLWNSRTLGDAERKQQEDLLSQRGSRLEMLLRVEDEQL